eukprot:TRINITY_DN3026_c0_g1_i2.p1 TRINITY_DN3026_c0_g1~~TRINITY_DN3026_c0_g1_i2.p1  ORF type:complete len:671 (+),score=193.31 TRINITY_DN3026_c0_g1_i2:151-2163(+)
MSDYLGGEEGGYGEDGMDDRLGFNELEIDEDLTITERIRKYAKSDLVLHRLYIIREVPEAAQQLGFDETRSNIVPMLEEMANDPEPVVRQALLEQIPPITQFMKTEGGDRGYMQVLHILLPLVAEMTTDRNPQVRATSMDTIEMLSSLLNHEDLEPYLLPIVRSLANDATEEEHRVEAAQLLHALAPVLGGELTQQVVLPYITKLAEDPVFRVRKAVASNLGNIAQTVGMEATTQHLLPLFVSLSQDDIWGVRKGCAEALVQMASSVSSIERYSNLIEVFERLAEDTSRWVRSAAYQNLGPFIATFEGHQVTPKLIRYYTSMVADTNSTAGASKYGDSEIVTYCAFNFPAVLVTVGSSRWPELSETFLTLAGDLQWRVRRTLAHSLHEVARILGGSVAESSLLPTFELFLRDLDEVRVGVIRHFAEFLEVLPMETRERYVPILQEVQADSANWRFRRLLAKQLSKLAVIFSPDTTTSVILPLAFSLVLDPVSRVRTAAAQGMAVLMMRLDELPPTTPATEDGQPSDSTLAPISHVDSTTARVIALATEPYFASRQMFVLVCEPLVDIMPPARFTGMFLNPLLALANDKVANVRLAAALVISQKLIASAEYRDHPEVKAAYDRLKQDTDRDVRHNASLPSPSQSSSTQSSSSSSTPAHSIPLINSNVDNKT